MADAAPTTSTTSTTTTETKKTGGGGGKVALIIIGVILLLCVICGVVALIFGKSIMDSFTSESFVESIIESGTDGDVDFDADDGSLTITDDDGSTYSYGETTDWPDDMPSEVPEPREGTIVSSSKMTFDDSTTWTVSYEDTRVADFNAYQSLLENDGWTVDYEWEDSTGTWVTLTKGEFSVSLSFTVDDDSLVLMVSDGNE